MAAEEEVIICRMAHILIDYCTCKNSRSQDFGISHLEVCCIVVWKELCLAIYLEEHCHCSCMVSLEPERTEYYVAFEQL